MTKNLPWPGWIFCLLLTLLAASTTTFSQSTRGQLAGNITDVSGAIVVGANILAIQTDTGVKSETVSTSSGGPGTKMTRSV